MQRFYLVRHAESLGNAGVPDVGRNPDLSPLGVRQAAALAAYVGSAGAQVRIWSSPFARAVQTACAVADVVDARVRLEPGIHEFCPDAWFAVGPVRFPSLREVQATHPRIDVECDEVHWWPAEGEDEATLSRRSTAVAERLLREAAPGTTVLVGHGASVAALAHALVPSVRPDDSAIPNASITEIRHQNGETTLMRLCDTSHLEGLGD